MSENTKDWIVLYARVVMGAMFLITGVRKSFGMLGGGGFAGSTKFVASQDRKSVV